MPNTSVPLGSIRHAALPCVAAVCLLSSTGALSALAASPQQSSRSAPPANPRGNFIGASKVPVAQRHQSQIPFQATPTGPKVTTPPMIKQQQSKVVPATLPGFYPALYAKPGSRQIQANQSSALQFQRTNLHPERAWQSSTSGSRLVLKQSVSPSKR